MTFDDIVKVYEGSDADATRALYARLVELAPRGVVAMNLIRTLKASTRAKVYRGRSGRGGPSYRAMAYDKKDWSIGELCRALVSNADAIPVWGWGFDKKAIGFEHVLYVDLPGAGQVSFHTSLRRDGLDYAGAWDGIVGVAPRRICLWTEAVLDGREVIPSNEGVENAAHARTEGVAVDRAEIVEGKPTEGQKAFDL